MKNKIPEHCQTFSQLLANFSSSVHCLLENLLKLLNFPYTSKFSSEIEWIKSHCPMYTSGISAQNNGEQPQTGFDYLAVCADK